MTTKLAFVDIETTSLDRERAQVWEVGLILRSDIGSGDQMDVEYEFQLEVDLGDADPQSLAICRFYDRYHPPKYEPDATTADLVAGGAIAYNAQSAWAADFVRLTAGAHFVGNVPSFDDHHLQRLIRRSGHCPMWHYHLIDVESLVAGHLTAAPERFPMGRAPRVAWPPWDSAALSRFAGVDPDTFDRHTALGDARWARALYDAVMT